VTLNGQVAYHEGPVVSKALAQNPAMNMTLFAFDKDEETSTHESDGVRGMTRTWRSRARATSR